MLSEITSLLNFFVDAFEGRKFKNIIYILIFLSIILVKPIMYYSTLYVAYCQVCAALATVFGIILFIYKIYCNVKHENYHNDTVNALLFTLFALAISLMVESDLYDDFWTQIYETENLNSDLFLSTIHAIDYFNGFYDYVSSYFSLILLYAIEFVNSVVISFLIIYILFKLYTTEKPLKFGLISTDLRTIMGTFLIIKVSSPWMYPTYLEFWNKIF